MSPITGINATFAKGMALPGRVGFISQSGALCTSVLDWSLREHVGFSAQAVEKIIHEAVTKTDQGYRLVNNDPIMWAMLNAVKEQQKHIETQQKQIDGLLNQNARQRKLISGLTRTVRAINLRTQTQGRK